MTENTPGQSPDKNRSAQEARANENTREHAGHQKGSADRTRTSSLDEKSSTMGRRDKGSGLSTKDGLTGSDYDGQVTE